MNDLTADEREAYEERLAICMAQPDVSDERAREVARAMVERMREGG